MLTDFPIAYFLHTGVKFPLFDIDGTLVEGGNKTHVDAFDFVLKTVYNLPTASVKELQAHGMIDTQILIEILKLHGVPEDVAKSKMPQATKEMAKYFIDHKEQDTVIVIDGVENVLKELKYRKIPTGLLTGNVEEIGWSKMELAGLREYFNYGAFGNHAFKRADLIPLAKEQLQKMANIEIPIKHFVIIGDTPLDIAAAKAGGVEVISVASGMYSADELQKAGADLVIDKSLETDKILKFLNVN